MEVISVGQVVISGIRRRSILAVFVRYRHISMASYWSIVEIEVICIFIAIAHHYS